jgi:hypothetical protein
VKYDVGMGMYQAWQVKVLEEVTRTREQVLAALWPHAVNHRTTNPRRGAL